MTQQARLGWGDRAILIGISITIVGFTWLLHSEHREDRRIYEERWNATNSKYEDRWAELHKELHVLDKELDKIKSK